MNSVQRELGPNVKLHFDVIDLLSDTELGKDAGNFGEFFLRFDAIVFEYGYRPVFSAVDGFLQIKNISKAKLISTLIARLRLAVINSADDIESVRESLFSVLSDEHLALTIEAYCADVNRHIWSDRADLAVGALVQHLDWLRSQNVEVSSNMLIEAAFTCNRFEQHFLAAEFSYLAYNQAIESGDDFAIDRASFFVLNSNRLAGTGGRYLKEGYARQNLKLETGRSSAFRFNQFLTPVFAAFTEFSESKPDLGEIDKLLGLAADIGHPDAAYCRKAWMIARGLQYFHRGDVRAARESYEELWCSTSREDRAIDKMAELLARRLQLARVYQPQKAIVPASAEQWRLLSRHVEPNESA
ncbi:MAG: hypothetical protein ACPGSC_02685 [Granulosicoccaceae bacterium]